MKWIKLDGFNQPEGATVLRWNDYFDGKEDGYWYEVGDFHNEVFYSSDKFLGNKRLKRNISELMGDDACYLELWKIEEAE